MGGRILAANNKDYVDGEIIVKYKTNKINLDSFSGRFKAASINLFNSLEVKDNLKEIMSGNR